MSIIVNPEKFQPYTQRKNKKWIRAFDDCWIQYFPVDSNYTQEKAKRYLNKLQSLDSQNLLKPILHGLHSVAGEEYYYSVYPKAEVVNDADILSDATFNDSMIALKEGLKMLNQANLRHGDLQLKNVMRYNGQLVLIDYDEGIKIGIQDIEFNEEDILSRNLERDKQVFKRNH